MDKKRENRDIRKVGRLLGFILLLCASSTIWGLEFPGHPIAYYSKSAKQFHVIYGDTLYSTGIYKEDWERRKLIYPEGFDFDLIRSRFVPISTSNADYFVVDGCGWVLQLLNDSIFRKDHSFDHRNQHGAFFLSARDTVCAIGGYGFFESTNITTYYDFDTKGWFARNYSGSQLPPASGFIVIYEGDNLFVFGGSTVNSYQNKSNTNVYCINTRNWKVRELGKIGFDKTFVPNSDFLGIHIDGNWIHQGENIYYVLPNDNEVRKFRSDKFKAVSDFCQVNGRLLVTQFEHNQKEIKVLLYDTKEFLGTSFRTLDFIVENNNEQYIQWQSFIIPSLLLIFAIGYLWQRKLERRKEANVIANEEVQNLESDLEKEKQQEEEILTRHAGEVVWALTELEQSLLEFLILKRAEGVEMNELNPFFDYGQPNFDTLKKRRELKLRELKVKLAGLNKLTLDEVWTERRLESDRRIKRLYLHPAIEIEKSESN